MPARKKAGPEPEQLALGGLPTGGHIVPMEAPVPSFSDDAWDVLQFLQYRSGPKPSPSLPEAIGRHIGISTDRATAALQTLAANGCARYQEGRGQLTSVGWVPTTNAKLVWRRWGETRKR
jgi:hypothetical protein